MTDLSSLNSITFVTLAAKARYCDRVCSQLYQLFGCKLVVIAMWVGPHSMKPPFFGNWIVYPSSIRNKTLR